MNSEEKPDNESQPLVISSRLLSSRPILLIWIILFAAALISYCLWNEPLRRAAIHLLPLITSLGFLLSICGIGFPLARRLAGEQDRLMQGITATVFGLGLTAVFVFILGMAGHLSPIWLWSWVILGAVLFLVACFLWRPFNLSVSLRNGWTILSACVLTAFLGMSLPFVVAPEVSTDALSYHLLIPKLYLTLGKVAHLPLFVESNYPSLAEYNYLLILRLSDEIVCKCFHFWVTVLLLLCLSCVVRKITDRGSSLLAPALFLSMPVTAIHMGWAWNDFIYTLMIVLSLFYLLNYHLATDKIRAGNDLLVAGLMAGLASWTKYTFAIFFFAILPLLLLGVRKWNWNNRKSLLFFAGILVIAPFWLVQNWIFTGNPVYPFLNHVFQSPYWTETANAYFHSALRRWEIQDWNWTTYFTFPVFITLKPRLVDVHTGILPLVLLPFLFAKSLNKGMTFLKYFVLSCTIVWLLIQTETRSLLSLFAVLFCLVSVCIQHWDWPGRFWKIAFAGFIILAVVCNFVITMLTTYHLSDPVKYFVGLETKPQYLRRQIGSQAVYEYLNSEKKVRKVMLVGFHDPFYLKHPFLFSSFTDPPVAEVLTHDAGSEADIRAKLRSLGVTHIALDLKNYERENKEGLYSWSAEKRARFQSFIQNECRQIARFGDDIIFEIK